MCNSCERGHDVGLPGSRRYTGLRDAGVLLGTVDT